MKKHLLAALMCILALGATAQVRFRSVELKTSPFGDFGIGVGTELNLSEEVDIVPSFNVFRVDGENDFSLDADFHYKIDLGNEFHLFPLAGPVLYHFGALSAEANKWGVNLGCGCDYDLNYNWTVFAEGKYQFLFNAGGFEKTFVSFGVKYRF